MQLTRSLPADVRPVSLLEPTASKDLYFALLDEPKQDAVRHRAADYLRDQLEIAADLPCDLPVDPAGLGDWLGGHTE